MFGQLFGEIEQLFIISSGHIALGIHTLTHTQHMNTKTETHHLSHIILSKAQIKEIVSSS